MNTQFLNFVLGVVKATHPELGNLINAVIKYEPQITEAIPVIELAAKEGPGALAAAEQAAPELAAAVRRYVSAVVPPQANAPKVAENIARQIAGQAPMTTDQEDAWRSGSNTGA